MFLRRLLPDNFTLTLLAVVLAATLLPASGQVATIFEWITNLAIALRDGGAEVTLCASNPLSTQDDVAAALVAEYGILTFYGEGEDEKTYYNHLNAALDAKPHMTMDDGADLLTLLHTQRSDLLSDVVGGTDTLKVPPHATAAQLQARG